MKNLLVVSSLVVLLAAVSIPWVYGNARRTTVLESNQRYTYIEIPPGIMLCGEDSLGGIRCLNLPPGTFLMLPVPDEAPVDTLRDRL